LRKTTSAEYVRYSPDRGFFRLARPIAPCYARGYRFGEEMALSLGTVYGARVAILLPVGSPGERMAASMSLDPIIPNAFGIARHSFLYPASFDEKRYNPGTRQIDTNSVCVVVVDTSYNPTNTKLMRKVRYIKSAIHQEYLKYNLLYPHRGGPPPWLRNGIHVTVGSITSFV